MRLSAKVAGLAALASVWSSCSTSPVGTYKDTDFQVSKDQTFKWLEPSDAKGLNLDDPYIDYITSIVTIQRSSEIEDRLRPVIEQVLQQKGYRPDRSGSPDFYVTYYAQAYDQSWLSSWSGTTPSLGGVPVVISPDFDRQMLRQFQKGNVYIVLYSPRTKSPIWTGVDIRPMPERQLRPDEIVARVNEVISQLSDQG